MAQDVVRVRGLRNRLNALFAPPAWAVQYHASLRGSELAPDATAARTRQNDNAAVQTPQ
jgi:hypothetical protein